MLKQDRETLFDPLWEKIHHESEWGAYPPEELIRFTAKNYYKRDRSKITFLDLGCGQGASSLYLAREGFSVRAIDGSASAINKMQRRLAREGLKVETRVGDVAQLPYASESFDCIIDLTTLSCLIQKEAELVMYEIYRVLKLGGTFFSVTHQFGPWCDRLEKTPDERTFIFPGRGRQRYSTEQDIKELYSAFDRLSIDFTHRSLDNRLREYGLWTIQGSKSPKPLP